MAYNNDYGNNDNNDRKYNEPVVYSPYGTSNTDGVDPSALSYTFFNGLLKISISPMKAGAQPTDKHIWDYDNAVSVWLTHTKAKMLHDEILYMLDHGEIINSGVPTGKDGLISFSTGKEFGVESPCLSIRKIDPNTGEVVAIYVYQFKDHHHYAVRNFDPNDPGNYEQVYYPMLEVHQLLTMLNEYVKSCTGAPAYGNMNFSKYDNNRLGTKIDLIMDKMGIEKQSGNYSRGPQGYFANNQGASSSTGGANAGFMNSPTMDEMLG